MLKSECDLFEKLLKKLEAENVDFSNYTESCACLDKCVSPMPLIFFKENYEWIKDLHSV